MMPWRLGAHPLAAGVPLEGSDTVEGLRTLERQRLAELLQGAAGGSTTAGAATSGRSATGGGRGWQRAFQRYRGPFIEQLAVEDLKQAPKSWALFWKGARGEPAEEYNLPASLAVLHERAEENFVTFLPNYLRLAAAVFLATFYLRPKALLGAVAVAFSIYRSVGMALQRQQQEAAVAATGTAGTDGRGGRHARPATADPNEQAVTAAMSVVTWLLVAYTRCLPMMLLGAATSLFAVLVHCGLRRAPSESRHKGRQPLGYTWRQVLGREPVPGLDPRALFRQLAAASVEAAALQLRRGWLYCKYYAHVFWDSLGRSRSLRRGSRRS